MDTITENTQGYTQPDYNQFLNMDSHQQPNYATLTSQSHKQPISGKFKNIIFFKKVYFYNYFVAKWNFVKLSFIKHGDFRKTGFPTDKKSIFRNIHI